MPIRGVRVPILSRHPVCMYVCMYIYIYICICAVKLKTGPIFALFKAKNWSIFLFFLFLIFENLILPAERRGFLKNKQKQQKKHILKLKTGPIMLRNMLGPVFNFNLDQFLTLEFLFFLLKPLFL